MGLRLPGRVVGHGSPTAGARGRAWVSDPAGARSENVALPTCKGRAVLSEHAALPGRARGSDPAEARSESVALPRSDKG